MNGSQQAQIDRTSYDMFVDAGRSYARAARELGCTPGTVRARVARHIRRDRGVTDEQAAADRQRTRDLDARLRDLGIIP